MTDILCKLYDKIIIPEAVREEFGEILLQCMSIQKLENLSLVNLLKNQMNLGKGEAEAIALSYMTGNTVVLDDQKARKIAAKFSINFVGSLGLLLRAEREGIIHSAYQNAIKLRDKGFFVSENLLEIMRNRS